MLSIKLDIIGLDTTLAFYDGMIARIADMTPAFKDIRLDFIASEKELFASEGGSGENGTWDDWSESYTEWREWEHPEAGTNKMILSGGLLDSLVGAGPGHVARMTANTMEVGSDLPAKDGQSLAFIHARGFTAKYPYGNTAASPIRVASQRKTIDPTTSEIDTWTRMIFSRILGEIV